MGETNKTSERGMFLFDAVSFYEYSLVFVSISTPTWERPGCDRNDYSYQYHWYLTTYLTGISPLECEDREKTNLPIKEQLDELRDKYYDERHERQYNRFKRYSVFVSNDQTEPANPRAIDNQNVYYAISNLLNEPDNDQMLIVVLDETPSSEELETKMIHPRAIHFPYHNFAFNLDTAERESVKIMNKVCVTIEKWLLKTVGDD